ncbi:MAG: PEP-CTERM sorting domain-containing protein [Acidobacteria bacterium]|nr:PEP-CTERM sorting domain-containing protein [Acidobacteriota bacterium]
MRLSGLLTTVFIGAAVGHAAVIGTYTDKSAFVNAVGSSPLGQENFSSLASGLRTQPFQKSGILYKGFQSIQGGALVSCCGPSAFIGFDVIGGLTYIGFDYTSSGGSNPRVDVDLNSFQLSDHGFFGVLFSSSGTPGHIEMHNGNISMDNILYAGGPGISESNPLYPETCATNIGQTLECLFALAITVGWVDPIVANAYRYETLDGSHFLSLNGFPSGFGAPFQLYSGSTFLGSFGPGDQFVFANGGVTEFTIRGITPSVDGSNPAAFPIQVVMDTAGTQLKSTAFFQSETNVPEPSTLTVLGLSLAVLRGGHWLRRRGRSPRIVRF